MKTKKRKKISFLSGILFFIAVLILVGSLIFLEVSFIESSVIPHQPQLDTKNEDNEKEMDENTVDPTLEHLKELYEQNHDLNGWITIPNTNIDYPVMFTKNEDFYLRRDFYGHSSTAGTLYIDKHQDMQPRDINIIIHGHNMDNGSMFHDLLNYKEKDYYESHKKFSYYTLEAKEEYEIIAVFLSKVYYVSDNVFKYYKFYGEQSESSYEDYITNIKSLSLYPIDITATYPEKLITLSTCEYSQENGRLVVVAKQIS